MRTLEAYGYNTAPLWKEHNDWLATIDERQPTDEDRTWATRKTQPSSLEQHFIQELKFPIYANDDNMPNHLRVPVGWRTEKQYKPELLSSGNCFKDRHFCLTPGQREVLRNRHGLTPAQTIIITDVALFPNTNIIWSFTLKSAEHVDIRRRKHVLLEVVIAPAAQFFKDGAALDKEREAEAVEKDLKRVSKGGEAKTVRVKALQYYG